MSKHKIYKITSNHTNDVFIGSTIRTLQEALEDHESTYNRHLKDDKNHYCTSFKLLKQSTYNIELIIEVNENEMVKIKNDHIKNTQHCVNKHVAGRTQKEWQQDTSQHRLEVAKEYYEKNKEKIKENKKEYYKNNKDTMKKRDVITCVCSGTYSGGQEKKHSQTKKHQDFINGGKIEIT